MEYLPVKTFQTDSTVTPDYKAFDGTGMPSYKMDTAPSKTAREREK